MSADLLNLVLNAGQPRILVVGDLALDRDLCAEAEGIYQEATVFPLKSAQLGGAGAVAATMRGLGARVTVVGVVGQDQNGQRIRHLLNDLSIDYEGVITDHARPTTVKDCEADKDRWAVDNRHLAQMESVLKAELRKSDIVLASDHGQGVCSPGLMAWIISNCRALGLRIIANPIHGHDYRKFHGASAIITNRMNAGLATGRILEDWTQVQDAASHLREELGLEAAVITLEKDGMFLCHADGRLKRVPAGQRQGGGGDIVLSALTIALSCGADYEEAMALANNGGGLPEESERIEHLRAA